MTKRRYVKDIPLTRQKSNPVEEYDRYKFRQEDTKGLSFWADIERGTDIERESPVNFLLIVLCVCLMSVGGWFVYRWMSADSPMILPVLKPESSHYRVRPENAGGISVPYQDTMVYNQDRSQGERVMPPQEFYYAQEQKRQDQGSHSPQTAPEQPYQHPPASAIATPQKQEEEEYARTQSVSSRSYQKDPLVSQRQRNVEEPRGETGYIEPPAHPQQRQDPSLSRTSVPRTEEEVLSSLEEDVFHIQVGFFKSQRIANRELTRLKKRHGRLLADYDLDMQTMGQGRTRILIGPFYSRTQALSIAMRLGHRSRVIKETR